MYYGSDAFNEVIESSNGKALKPLLMTEDESIVIEQFENLVYHGGMNNTERLVLGATNSAYIEVSAYTDADLEGKELIFKVGAELSDGTIEYAPMGLFTVQRVSKDEDVSTFVAIDRMYRFDKLYDDTGLDIPTSLEAAVYNLVVTQCGFTGFEAESVISNSGTILESLNGKGYTCRDVLSFICGTQGSFAYIDVNGMLRTSSVMGNFRIDKVAEKTWEFEKADEDYSIGYIEMQKDDEFTYVSGTKGDNIGLSQFNPLATQSLCDKVYESMKNIAYRPCVLEILDDIRIRSNDVIRFTDIDGTQYEFPCMQLEHNLTSGYTRIVATGNTELTDNYVNEGSTTRELRQTKMELSLAKKSIAENANGIVTVTEKTAEIEANINGIQADFTEKITETRTYAQEVANTAESNANNATDAKLTNYSTTTEMQSAIDVSASGIRTEVSASVQNLQQQIDGAIETFTGSAVPTLSNEPASNWTDDTEKDKHIGDLYIVNSDGGDYEGFYYRFEKSGTTYQWVLLKDAEITKALQDAKEANEKAQSVADDLANNYSTTTEMNSAIEQTAESIASTVEATYTTKDEFSMSLDTIGEASGTLIHVTDASNDDLQDVIVYGKSTQASTPTPDAPIDIASVGDDGEVTITGCSKNMFDDTPIISRTAKGVTYSAYSGGGTKLVGTTTGTYSQNSRNDYNKLKLSPGSTVYVRVFSDVSTAYIIFRRYLSDGTSATVALGVNGGTKKITIESNCTEVGIFIVASNTAETVVDGYLQIVVSATNDITEYVPYNGNTATITSNLPLRGIKVASGGNYTDASGQMWICDSIEKYADGSGKYIKRTRYMEYNGASSEAWGSLNGYFRIAVTGLNANKEGLCNICPVVTSFPSNGAMYNSAFVYFRYNTLEVNNTSMTVDDFKTWLAEHPMQLVAILAEPIETPLTAEQVAEFETLQTYKPVTTLYNSDGAGLEVTYIRDTPLADTVSRVSKSESKITQLADEIELKVDKDGVISSINLTPETVKIEAEKIDLVGKVTADMIQAGAVTAEKIDVEDLFAQSITATDFNITGGSVDISTSTTEDNPEESKIVMRSTEAGEYIGFFPNKVLVSGEEMKAEGIVYANKSAMLTCNNLKFGDYTYPTFDTSDGIAIAYNRYGDGSGFHNTIELNGCGGTGGIYLCTFNTDTGQPNRIRVFDSFATTTTYADYTAYGIERSIDNSFDITVAASTTTTLYDFSSSESGVYEVIVTCGDYASIYTTVCKSTASTAMASPVSTSTIGAVLAQGGQYTLTIKNGSTSEQTFSCRIIKKS